MNRTHTFTFYHAHGTHTCAAACNPTDSFTHMQQRIASLIRRVVQQQQASHKKEVSAIERETFFGPNARTLFQCFFATMLDGNATGSR